MTTSLTDAENPIVRKVQLTGGSTFTVSLPKEWARGHDLEAGSTLYLYALQDRLVAAPSERSERRRSAEIDAGELDPGQVSRRVRAAYIAGCDTVRVRAAAGLETATARAASRTIADLVGMTVASETETVVTGRSLLDTTEVSLTQTVVQLRQLALSMHREALEAVVEGDADLGEAVVDRDDEVDRLFALVSRQFHASLVDVGEIDRLEMDRTEAFRHYRTARQLERVADHAAAIAAVAGQQSDPPSEPVGERLRDLGESAREVVEAAIRGETEAAIEQRAALGAAVAEADRELYDADEPDAYRYGRVLERLRRTAAHGGNVVAATQQAGFVGASE